MRRKRTWMSLAPYAAMARLQCRRCRLTPGDRETDGTRGGWMEQGVARAVHLSLDGHTRDGDFLALLCLDVPETKEERDEAEPSQQPLLAGMCVATNEQPEGWGNEWHFFSFLNQT